MKLYFIPKFSDIGIYKIDAVELDRPNPIWRHSEQDCFFIDKQVLYHGTSVWRINVDRLEFYVSIKDIQEWAP